MADSSHSTITLQVGNSDDRLTQVEWSNFVNQVKREVKLYSSEIFFFGDSPNWTPWQNVCFVFQTRDKESYEKLRSRITTIRIAFDQDSVAWTEGVTVFL